MQGCKMTSLANNRRLLGEAFLPWALMVVVLALPLTLAFANRGMAVLLGVAVLAALIDRVRGITRGWSLDWRALAPLAAFLLWGLASALWSETPGLAVPKTVQLAALTIGGLLVLCGVPAINGRQREQLLLALYGGLAAVTALILFEKFTGLAFARALYQWNYGHVPEPGIVIITRYKTAATVGSIWLVLAAWVSLDRRHWLAAAGCMAAAVSMAMATSSLTGLVAMGAAAMVSVTAWASPRLPRILAALALATTLALAPLAAWMPASRDIIVALPWMPDSASHRTVIWHFVGEKVIERPLLGWGLDASRELPGGGGVGMVFTNSPGHPVGYEQAILPLHPHNFALQVWVETGAVGAALFLLFLLGLIWSAGGLPGGRGVIAMAVIAAASVVGAISFGIWQSWWLSNLWLTAVIVVAMPARRAQGV